MGPFASQLLLESWLLPCLIAGLIVASARWRDRGILVVLAPALAILAAVGSTYILTLGWPKSVALGSQAKIMLSAFVGLIIGFGIEKGILGPKLGLTLGAIAIPAWLGLPALLQARGESVLLTLPLILGLLPASGITNVTRLGTRSWVLVLLTIALGLAPIAAFAKALSFAELSLALGGALLALLLIGRDPIGAPATLTAGAMLLALMTALLLYSEASLPALLLLTSAIGAERLARLASGRRPGEEAVWLVAVFCLMPAALAIVIARIDAGSFSIY